MAGDGRAKNKTKAQSQLNVRRRNIGLFHMAHNYYFRAYLRAHTGLTNQYPVRERYSIYHLFWCPRRLFYIFFILLTWFYNSYKKMYR
jgi:hypothetical protein